MHCIPRLEMEDSADKGKRDFTFTVLFWQLDEGCSEGYHTGSALSKVTGAKSIDSEALRIRKSQISVVIH